MSVNLLYKESKSKTKYLGEGYERKEKDGEMGWGMGLE